ncbi:anti-sigma factor [Cryptosporangium aurantiacum]|uniref:Anti-sigma-K factor rskA n=1 Tax=Cryptosporangium aurantiacum TaxID=134849 RepID=A0A1M7RKP4_9ACTN|nr:anti-sigma factor [Cryptosporangium aurantiacum]SHN46883.1 Anti-sigma-K factor rskA [Cryptosporangium aurantiacum]
MTDEQKPRSDEGDGPLLTDDRTEAPIGSGKRRWSRRLTTFAMACGLVIGAAALTLEVEEQRDRDQRSLIVAEQERLDRIESVLTAPDAVSRNTTTESGLRLSTVFSSEHHAAVVTYTDLPDIPERQTYQLWRVRNDKTKSMRILAPGARKGSALVLDLEEGDAVAFTVEPEGGVGQPTGDIVVGLPLT